MKNLIGAYTVLGCKVDATLDELNYKYLLKYNSTDNEDVKCKIKEAYLIALNNIKNYPKEYINDIDAFVNITNKHFIDFSIKSFSKNKSK